MPVILIVEPVVVTVWLEPESVQLPEQFIVELVAVRVRVLLLLEIKSPSVKV